MIKFGGDNEGRKVIGLILEPGNIERLKEGKPILVNGEELNTPGIDIIIDYTDDVLAKAKELRPMIGEHTIIKSYREGQEH